MLRSQLQVLLVALSSSVLLARVSSTPHRHIRTELLRPDTTQENEVSGSRGNTKVVRQIECVCFLSDFVPVDNALRRGTVRGVQTNIFLSNYEKPPGSDVFLPRHSLGSHPPAPAEAHG